MQINKIEDLIGKTVTSIDTNSRSLEYGKDIFVTFKLNDGTEVSLGHYQNCCESVSLNDVVGDWNDLLNSPILVAEEVISSKNPSDYREEYQSESFLWTFYKFATVKGYVDLRFYGESNGYYSESVDLFVNGEYI